MGEAPDSKPLHPIAAKIVDSFALNGTTHDLRLDGRQLRRWRIFLDKKSKEPDLFVDLMALARRMAAKKQQAGAIQLVALASIGIEGPVMAEMVEQAEEFSPEAKAYIKKTATSTASMVDGLTPATGGRDGVATPGSVRRRRR